MTRDDNKEIAADGEESEVESVNSDQMDAEEEKEKIG